MEVPLVCCCAYFLRGNAPGPLRSCQYLNQFEFPLSRLDQHQGHYGPYPVRHHALLLGSSKVFGLVGCAQNTKTDLASSPLPPSAFLCVSPANGKVRLVCGCGNKTMEVEAFQRLDPETFYRRFVNNGVRPDGRELRAVRPISVDVGVLSGDRVAASALVGLGSTKVLAGITLQVGQPNESTPMCGMLGKRLRYSDRHAHFSFFYIYLLHS